jgi:tRNA-dihydrouridine synthase
MAELSHRALRELIGNFCDEYFTEMISAPALVSGGVFERWYVDPAPFPEKLVYQLVGGDTNALVKAVSILDKQDVLGIDLNMGCSAPAITRTGAGVSWMASLDKAGELVRLARTKTKRRLSCKLRLGLPGHDFDYLVRFCQRLQNEGLDFITLHPRKSNEKFKGKARWSYVCELRKNLHIPVAGSGDISSAEEMFSKAKDCDAVMIGRLAVRRPWVFRQARNLATATSVADLATTGRAQVNLEETGLLFLELLSRHQPPEFYLSRARRFFSYYCDNLKWATHVKNLINREQNLLGIERVWRNYFSELPEEQLLEI